MDLLYTAHVPEGEGPYPTIVALHGWGASAHDLIGLAPILNAGGALVLCPQGPLRMQVGPGQYGYGWFQLGRGAPQDPGELERAADRVRGFLDAALDRYPIDPHKLVLLGFSQGGVTAYSVFLSEPSRFAGLVALSSWLPAPLAGSVPATPALAERPVLVMHGTRDPMIDVERARESRKLLLERQVPLTYREYEMGHEIAPDALRDLMAWLDDKVFQPIRLA